MFAVVFLIYVFVVLFSFCFGGGVDFRYTKWTKYFIKK